MKNLLLLLLVMVAFASCKKEKTYKCTFYATLDDGYAVQNSQWVNGSKKDLKEMDAAGLADYESKGYNNVWSQCSEQ